MPLCHWISNNGDVEQWWQGKKYGGDSKATLRFRMSHVHKYTRITFGCVLGKWSCVRLCVCVSAERECITWHGHRCMLLYHCHHHVPIRRINGVARQRRTTILHNVHSMPAAVAWCTHANNPLSYTYGVWVQYSIWSLFVLQQRHSRRYERTLSIE